MTVQEIFEARGYIVFQHDESFPIGTGWPSGTMYADAREPLLATPLVVIARTDRADWLEQFRLAGLPNRPQPVLRNYYRVVAE